METRGASKIVKFSGKGITPAVIARILSAIANGMTLKGICAREGVSYSSAWKMLTRRYPSEYESAKECGTQKMVDMAFARALHSTPETAASDRMFCDYVRWLAERRLSKEYGNHKAVTIKKGPSFILEGNLLTPTG